MDFGLSPITKSNLKVDYPDFYEHIFQNRSKILSIKKGGEIPKKEGYFIYIAEGAAKSWICNYNGTERLLYLVLSDSLLTGNVSESFQASFFAYRPCVVWYFSIDLFFSFLQMERKRIYDFYNIICTRCNILMQYVLGDSKYSSKYKVLQFIYRYAIEQGHTKDETGNIMVERLPINIISSFTNVYRSNVTIYLNDLVSLDILEISSQYFILKRLDGLEEILSAIITDKE